MQIKYYFACDTDVQNNIQVWCCFVFRKIKNALRKTRELVKLTWAERCARNKLLFGYRWLDYAFLLFKVIQGHRLLHKSKTNIWFPISE